MKIRHLLLASSAVAALSAVSPAEAGTFYVSVIGGANWARDFSAQVTTCCGSGQMSAKVDTGFLIGGAIGVHADRWLHGLRAELEASYRRNRIHGDWSTSGIRTSENGSFSGHMSTFAIMANLWYDIDMGWKVVPYVGAGAGWGRRVVEFAATDVDDLGLENGSASSVHLERTGFVYQLGAGLNYQVMPGVDIGLGYRFLKGPDIKTVLEIDQRDAPVNISGDNHSVLLSLTIDVDP